MTFVFSAELKKKIGRRDAPKINCCCTLQVYDAHETSLGDQCLAVVRGMRRPVEEVAEEVLAVIRGNMQRKE